LSFQDEGSLHRPASMLLLKGFDSSLFMYGCIYEGSHPTQIKCITVEGYKMYKNATKFNGGPSVN